MNAIDVAAIVPTFRRPTQVAETLRSSLAQRGVAVEVHVIDDSPDGARAGGFNRGCEGHLREAATPTRARPAIVPIDAGRSRGGRYIHFLDDDDIVVQGAHRAHADALDAAMTFGCVEPFGEDEVVREREF